ncbi:MAG: Gfo/Idh/MocA family oxidoreductase [Anaerolineae bacterium]|nr:Gfo/Idh/MocA family oxidoreductase [Anaerolineae bacterium]
MTVSPIRLGVISFAHGHVSMYLEAMRDFDDAVVVAGWDANRKRGESQCARFGLTFEPDLESLLKREDISAVFIASPTNKHAEHAMAAAQAGKHILLQKPMALTLADCDAIITAVQRYGVKFSLCYQMRCDPVNKAMKQLLDEGAVGKVALVKRRHAIGLLLSPSFAHPGNWHLDAEQNMGMFMDDASHVADWFYWMLGRPTSVIAEIDNVVTNVAPDDNGVAVFRFAGREIGVLVNSATMLAAEATTEIYGDRGVIVQNYGDAPSSGLPRPPGAIALKLYRAGESDWRIFNFPADTPHAARIRAVPRPLVDYLHDKAPPLATAEDGRVCIEMILAAYQAAREGRRITLT